MLKPSLKPLLYLFSVLFLSACSRSNEIPETQKRVRTVPEYVDKRGELTESRTWFDVQRYELDITPDLTNKTISGTVEMTYKVRYSENLMQVDLQAPMRVDSIFLVEEDKRAIREKMSFNEMRNRVFVKFKRKPAFQKVQKLLIYFHGTPSKAKQAPWQDGFVWKRDTLGKPFVGVTAQMRGASFWFPCHDILSDKPDLGVKMTLHVPKKLVAVGNGVLRSYFSTDSLDAYIWEVVHPISLYNISFTIGNFVHWDDVFAGKKGKLPLSFWVLEQNLVKAKFQFTQVKTMLRAFEHYFGPYPFYEDGYKIVEAPYLGMEHQSAIAYGNRYKNGYLGKDRSGTGFGNYWDFILIHESGHEWWGNQVSVAQPMDFWIHESLATYSEVLFTEYLFGKQAGAYYAKGIRKHIRNQYPILSDSALIHKSTDAYYKGANMWHTLRSIVGDVAFFAFLKAANVYYKHKMIDHSASFLQFVNQFFKQDFSLFFEHYLKREQVPTLQYIVDKAHKKVYFRFINCDAEFSMPLSFFGRKIIPTGSKWLSILLEDNLTSLPIWMDLIEKNYYLILQELEYNTEEFLPENNS